MTLLRVIPALTHYSDIVSDIPSGSMYSIYTYIYILTFFLAFYLAFYRPGVAHSRVAPWLKSRDPHLAGGEQRPHKSWKGVSRLKNVQSQLSQLNQFERVLHFFSVRDPSKTWRPFYRGVMPLAPCHWRHAIEGSK